MPLVKRRAPTARRQLVVGGIGSGRTTRCHGSCPAREAQVEVTPFGAPISRAAARVRDVAAALASAVARPSSRALRPPQLVRVCRVNALRGCHARAPVLVGFNLSEPRECRPRRRLDARAVELEQPCDDVALAARTYDEVLERKQSRFEPGANLCDVVAELALEQLERVAQRRRAAAG